VVSGVLVGSVRLCFVPVVCNLHFFYFNEGRSYRHFFQKKKAYLDLRFLEPNFCELLEERFIFAPNSVYKVPKTSLLGVNF
jgi:hypothetical protein